MMDAYADALGIAAPKKPASSEATMRAEVQGDMGANPESLTREIAAVSGDLQRPLDSASRKLLSDHLEDLKRQQTRIAPAPATTQADPYADALGIGGPVQRPPVAAAPVVAANQAPKLAAPDVNGATRDIRGVIANQVTGIGSSIVGGYKGLASLLTGGTMDDAANEVRNYQDAHTYQGTPQAISSFASPANPANWLGAVTNKAGEVATDLTGSPAAGTTLNAGLNGAALMLGLRGRAGTAPAEVGPARPGTGIYRPLGGATALPAPGEPAPVVPQQMPQQGAPVQVAPVANYKPFPTPAEVRMPQPLPTTPEAIQAVAEKAPATLFPETPTTGKFTPAEQVQRAKILESVGIDPSKLRKSAIAGDGIGGSTDFQTAKLDSQAGRHMDSIIKGERQALVGHAEKLVQDTGGTQGVDQAALYNRGGTILAPLDKLNDYYDAKARTLYDSANERAQGKPVTLDSFRHVLADDSEMTSPDRLTFRDAAKAFAKKNGMLQEDGSIAGNALQAETFRKWLNKNRTHSNGSYVDGLKESLDNDVLSSAGEDLYTQARALWQEKKATLDNPDGIAKLLQEEGVNRAVPKEMIAPKVVRMPVDQFGHIVQTLKNVPPEIQPAAQGAVNEIRAQFANEVHAVGSNQAGQWNAKGVTKYLQNNAARMAQVFTPEEVQAFRNLNDAGHIVAKDQSYPGAVVQGHNLVTHGVMHSLPAGGAAIGGALAGPAGAAVGAAAGRMAAGAVDNAATMRAVKKRTTKLSDLLETK